MGGGLGITNGSNGTPNDVSGTGGAGGTGGDGGQGIFGGIFALFDLTGAINVLDFFTTDSPTSVATNGSPGSADAGLTPP